MDDKKVIKALVIDDEKVVRDFLTRFLNLKGIEAEDAEDEFKAIEAVKKETFDLVFLELQPRSIGSPSLLRELKEINPESKYLIMSAHFKEDVWEEAKKEGAEICFKKPFVLGEILSEINKIRYLRGLQSVK